MQYSDFKLGNESVTLLCCRSEWRWKPANANVVKQLPELRNSINIFSRISEIQLTINADCVKQKAGRKKRGLKHKRRKNSPDNIMFVLWSVGVASLSFGFVHFRRLAAATLITRYREYFNILSRERIRKRRRMDHYVTYSKSYYTGRYQAEQGCILYHYLSHVRGSL